MAFKIKNPEVERLATEVSAITGESKTEAIRRALSERRRRLALFGGARTYDDLLEVLEREIWSKIPARLRGKTPSPRIEERTLGYGKHGV